MDPRAESLSLETDQYTATADWTVSHDFAFYNGGAEAVTERICKDVLPESQMIYLAGDDELAESMAPGRSQRGLSHNINRRNYRLLSPLMPSMVRQITPVAGHLLASSYAFANAVPHEGRKVIYCHSPLRQAWSGYENYGRTGPLLERLGTRLLQQSFQRHDREAVATADELIATSRAVLKRINTYYKKDAHLIPPPIDDELFNIDSSTTRTGQFIWAGRITEPYKQLGLLIESFAHLRQYELIVVGDGRDRLRLEKLSTPNVKFVGWKTRSELAEYYRSSLAVLFPSEDDFGLVPVEAMACGTPVIAYAAGGALDTVKPGTTGVFFEEQTVPSFLAAMEIFMKNNWNSSQISNYAVGDYGRHSFQDRMRTLLKEVAVQ
ncbi:glycosyltransferase [Arthrobacter sp. 35W]|uniref:glycosyltransferase n=1 Tax=Arthrobacter sp. 35W TaxID=1132441 RepID=UPI0009DDD7E2|nr:glycosyltransferase [Arthrobacter sp. 35W]